MLKVLKVAAVAGLISVLSPTTSVLASSDQKTIATDFLLKGLMQGDGSYINQYVAEDLIQHSPVIQDKRAGLLGYIDSLKSSNTSLSIRPVRVFGEGDLVVIQSAFESGGTKSVTFDLFRFEDGKIVEYWNGTQEIPEKKPINGRTMLDGATGILDLDKTAENKALVINALTDIMINGEYDKVSDYIDPTYIQHNPNGADGAETLENGLNYLKNNNTTLSFKEIHRVVSEGNFVFTLNEGEFAGELKAFYDLYRVKDGKIIEHWDVIQDVPEKMPHSNGMF